MNAKDAARLFVQLGTLQAESESGDGMTNLRVNKLLYFAQGYSLAKYGKPLFNEQIEAWDHGPVVPSVYHAYKGFGKNVIEDTSPQRELFSDENYNILLNIYSAARSISTKGLVDYTHKKDAPWYDVYYTKNNKGGIIPQEDIRRYFIKNPFCNNSIDSAIARLKQKAYTPKRDKNGVAIIPKEIANGWN